MRNNPYRTNDCSPAKGAAVLHGDALVTRLRAAEVPSMDAPSDGDSLPRAATRFVRTLQVSRVLTGLFLILHGLAHSGAGIVLAERERSWHLFDGTTLGTGIAWITTTLPLVSTLGFVAGGIGLLGVAGPWRHSRRLVLVAAIASLLILPLAEKPYAAVGMSIDALLVGLLALSAMRPTRGAWVWRRTLIEDASAITP
jgi:hypothetical protein